MINVSTLGICGKVVDPDLISTAGKVNMVYYEDPWLTCDAAVVPKWSQDRIA